MTVNGSAELAAVAARLKLAGDAALRLQLLRGLRNGAKPLIPRVQDAARAQLPRAGGLNEQVASQRVSVQIRTGARTAGVRLVTRAPDTQQTDQGFVRKPVFGNRKVWVRQEIPRATGWWSKTLAQHAPEVAPELYRVLEEVAAGIAGRL
jgi:hypothetical protein